MDNAIRIVTDSACDLSREHAEDVGIRVVPLTVRFDDKEFVDREELNSEQFWQQMRSSPELPSTAAPSPGVFEMVFRQAAEDGCQSVVCINLSSKLSATYQAAVTAAGLVREIIDVRVIDSQLCTVAQGTLCRQAAALAAQGNTVDAVISGVEALRSQLEIYGTLDTLDNLRKGGRIGAAGAFFASLLSVKPVITIRDGAVEAESRQRTRRRALDHLASLVVSRGAVSHVAVAHAEAPDLDDFLDRLEPVAKRKEISVSTIGPTIGTHGGPAVIAVSFVPSSARLE